MRGEERQQRTMLMVFNLEQRVPQDHPLRRIKQLAGTVLQGLSASFDRMYSATEAVDSARAPAQSLAADGALYSAQRAAVVRATRL